MITALRPGREQFVTATIVRTAACLVLVLLGALAPEARAHTRSISYSRWELDGREARAELRVPLVAYAFRAGGMPAPDDVAAAVTLTAGDAACAAFDAHRAAVAPEGWALYRWRVRCSGGGPRVLRSTLLADSATHAHFARVTRDGEVLERLLASGVTWRLDATAAAAEAPSWTRYVAVGVTHILSGADHLVFLLALLLLATSLGELARLVTSFTVAHTLTLGLAALGVVRPDAAAVEALIGFSIVLVAIENAWLAGGRDAWIPRALVTALLVGAAFADATTVPPLAWIGLATFAFCHFRLLADGAGTSRVAVAFAFGLVHGFGFAGNLLELELPARRLVPALFGFNVGVELGQLVLVAMTWPLLRMLVRRVVDARRLAVVASAPVLAVGVFWLVSRSVP